MTREEAIKIIDCYDIGFYDLSGEKIPAEKLAEAFDMAIEALQDRPTVDSVEVVFCKDCKNADVYDDGDCMCLLTGAWKKLDHFCSGGERREE